MSFTDTLEKILNTQDLTNDEAHELIDLTMSGALSNVQIAAWLSAMRTKGETATEIAAFVKGMRSKALHLPTRKKLIMDTCGTGGDRSRLINISTLTALTLASMGVAVAKHGNRAVSSSSGSADLLEKLNYPITETPEQAAIRLEQTNFCFMFAPIYHPAMKHVGPVRRELGVRTVFNLLGPLANPAQAQLQLLGVYDRHRLTTLAHALRELGVHRALVIHGSGLDEVHPSQPTEYCELSGQEIFNGFIEPNQIGLPPVDLDDLRVSDSQQAYEKAKSVIDATFDAGVHAVALNTAAALYLHSKETGETSDSLNDYLKATIPRVTSHIKEGKLAKWLKQSF